MSKEMQAFFLCFFVPLLLATSTSISVPANIAKYQEIIERNSRFLETSLGIRAESRDKENLMMAMLEELTFEDTNCKPQIFLHIIPEKKSRTIVKQVTPRKAKNKKSHSPDGIEEEINCSIRLLDLD